MKRRLVGQAIVLAVLLALPARIVVKSYSTQDGSAIDPFRTGVQRRFSRRNLLRALRGRDENLLMREEIEVGV